MFHRVVLPILIVGLTAFVAFGLYRRYTQDARNVQQVVRSAQQAPARKPFGPCEDHRTGLPMAPAVENLDPNVLVFSSDCRWLVSGNRSGSIQVFDRETGRVVSQVGGFGTRVTSLLVSPDDKFLFSSTQTGEDVLVWTLPNLARLVGVRAGGRGGSALAFDPRTSVLITGTSQDLQGWRIPLQGGGPTQVSQPLFTTPAQGVIHALALSPDGQYIAAGETGSVQLWKLDGGERPAVREAAVITPYEPKDWVLGVAFSADGKVLVSADRRKQIGVWQVPSLVPLPQAAANPPRWDLYQDPWKFTARPPRDYAGPDKAQLVIRLDDSTADRVYAAWAGRVFGRSVAQRGLVQAMGNAAGISFFDIFENRAGPTLSIPVSKVAAAERPDRRQEPDFGETVAAAPAEAEPQAPRMALSDQPPPADLAAGAEVFVVSGYEAARGGERVRVKLDRPGKRVLLVLSSNERVAWQVETSPETTVAGIVVAGGHGTSTLATAAKTRGFTSGIPYAYDKDTTSFGSLLDQLNKWFGVRKIDALRGKYSLSPLVEISQPDAPDAALTLEGPAVQAPSKNFAFVLHVKDYSAVPWTLKGQKEGRNLGYLAEGKAAVSPSGDLVYALKRDQLTLIDRKTGNQQGFALPDNFPRFSWAMDAAYDRRRNIVSVISLGGEGFFYRFDARARKWIDFRSVNNIDAFSLAYDRVLDRYVAWTDQGELLFISGEGNALFKVKVKDKLPGFGRLSGSSRARIGLAPNGNVIGLIAFAGDSVRGIWEYDVESQTGRLTYKSR